MTSTYRQFAVDIHTCNRCGLCAEDCPTRIIEYDASGYPQVSSEREANCLFCQHCLAICPEGAVSIRGLRPENSQPVAVEVLPTFEQMNRLVRARRSVRQYRPSNVDPDLIQRLLDALAHAPTGVNARQLTFTLIQDRDTLALLRTRVLEAMAAAAAQELPSRYAQFFRLAVEGWHQEQRDLVFRGAPHLLVVSAPPSTPTPQQDVSLTLAYFELLAQSAGLGTVWCGYLKVIFETVPSLKTLLSLAEDHVYYGMLFGYPAIQYVRTVQREGSAQIRRVSSIGSSGT